MARKQAIADLERAVAEAVKFFEDADEDLFDGYQSAHDVLSHLVFWHHEYVRIVTALADGRAPCLITGKFREFNALATQMFARQPLPKLARRLATLQCELDNALDHLDDWRANFPLKEEMAYGSVNKRVDQIRGHIEGHVTRLKRAERRKERHA